jgi:lactoylglutathione lyase
MKLGYCIHYVSDVPRSLDFYERAFGLERGFLHESRTYGEMKTGPTTLSFASEAMVAENGVPFRPSRASDAPPAVEIGLVTDDVPGAVERALRAGAVLVHGAKVKPWGQTVAYVRDPDGFLVELCTPVG